MANFVKPVPPTPVSIHKRETILVMYGVDDIKARETVWVKMSDGSTQRVEGDLFDFLNTTHADRVRLMENFMWNKAVSELL